jgi:hypothetical protein
LSNWRDSVSSQIETPASWRRWRFRFGVMMLSRGFP